VQPAAGDALVRRLGEAGPWLGAVGDGRLLHGDLSGGHVIFDAGRDVRLIDFGQTQVGDPRWDLARILLWDGDPALEALLDGYGHDLMTAEERRTVLPLYLFAYCSHHVVGHPNDGHIARVLDLSRWRELL
jgi:aminoglycoside phosphotransferase (APT) family kinase protein